MTQSIMTADELVRRLHDVMRRADEDFLKPGEHRCTDDEWDAALAEADAYVEARQS